MLENPPPELETSLFSLREDENDNETIHPNISDSVVVDTTLFEGFTDFQLDLSCLSAPSSPVASTSSLPEEEPSLPPPSPPPPLLSRSMSFSSQLPSLTTKKSTKKASSPQLSSSMGNSGGSWPLIKYAGRGTPIDRNRRLEWGGFAGEDIAEDGVLYPTVRSTSLDSAVRPAQRSISPDWHKISPLSSTRSNVTASATESISHLTTEPLEPPPELAPIKIDGCKPDEWDTIMQTVLGATAGPSTPETHHEDEAETSSAVDEEHDSYQKSLPPAEFSLMSQEQMQEHQFNAGLQIDLGLNAALDLGLGQRGGMNWFELGLLPSSASGRDSPSLYSQAPTPKASPPPSVHDQPLEQVSPMTAKVEVNDTTLIQLSTPWWKKILHRLRRLQTLITIHKEPF